MCLISEAIRMAMSRRNFMKSAGALAAAPLLAGIAGNTSATESHRSTHGTSTTYNTRVVLLGTAGGPSWWPDCDRVSASSALCVGDTIYLIDMGHGSTHRMAQAFNSGVYITTPAGKVEQGYPTFLRRVEALFFTHLHMDHTADYPSLLLVGHGAGINVDKPLKIIGPGNRGQLEADIYGFGVPVMNPSNPTPGTVEMTDYIFKAYAQTINDFTRDDGWPDFRSLFDVSDITLPHIPGFKDPNTTPCPSMSPFQIYKDNNVTVHATLVDHHQVFPSFAFRFDTADGSVVFSGDTGPYNRNLIKMAKGADILVHEVIDQDWINLLFGPNPSPVEQALVTHLESVHTKISDVGGTAEEAGVKTLVLNHIVPGNTQIDRLKQAQLDFSGSLIIGKDLMHIGVGKPLSKRAGARG